MNQGPLGMSPGIKELEQLLRLLWTQACLWDGIHPRSPQAVFSRENPYQDRYRRVYQTWHARRHPARRK